VAGGCIMRQKFLNIEDITEAISYAVMQGLVALNVTKNGRKLVAAETLLTRKCKAKGFLAIY
jgi:hypothetical protein